MVDEDLFLKTQQKTSAEWTTECTFLKILSWSLLLLHLQPSLPYLELFNRHDKTSHTPSSLDLPTKSVVNPEITDPSA